MILGLFFMFLIWFVPSSSWPKILVVLKTRTFRLATKLRQKFNRFSPFRKLTSFVTSFTAPWYMLPIQTSPFQKFTNIWVPLNSSNPPSRKVITFCQKSFLSVKESDNVDENWCLGKSRDSLAWITLLPQLTFLQKCWYWDNFLTQVRFYWFSRSQ